MKTDLLAVQMQLEEEAIGIGIENYTRTREKAVSRNDVANMAPENYMMRKALVAVSNGIQEHLMEHCRGGKKFQTCRNIMLKVKPEEAAYITLQMALSTSSNNKKLDSKLKLVSLAQRVGAAIRHNIDYNTFKAHSPGYLKAVEKTMDSKNAKYKATVLGITMDKKDIPREQWDSLIETTIDVGIYCIYRVIEAVGLFEIKTVTLGVKKEKIIGLTVEAADWIERAHTDCSVMCPQLLPMVVQPADWSGMFDGGFVSAAGAYKIPVVRYKMDGVARGEAAVKSEDLDKVYACLNALQRTPYRINTRIKDIMREGSHTGMGKLTSPDIKCKLPASWWTTDAEFKELCTGQPERIREWKISRKHIYDEWFRQSSHRRSLHWQLFLADKFSEFEEIFFCWNQDWRGRVYPLQQYINPQSDSNGKALIEFAHGKALGTEGVYWLAVHGANTYGKDKIEMDDRVQWVRDNQEMILDSAHNPIDGAQLWCEADDPYMFLAFCFEWAGYLKQGDTFVSHLPVGMDGSCSGLQHYSALLKDEEGGKHVNLVPTTKPSDIYTMVSTVAQQIVAKDVDNQFAALWHGKMDRKIAKPNTMTWAYSATLFGFANQLLDEIKKRDSDEKQKGGVSFLSEPKLNAKAATYMARVNLTAISQLVVKAVEAMQFLKGCAKVVADAGIHPSWVAPSGFKVMHHYSKQETLEVNTLFGSTRIRLSAVKETDVVHSRKNVTGIAPNYIHSLDASHLVLTVNKCIEEGITDFAMIHDSFGCHAADIPKLNRILRETFVEMYSGNLLEDFHKQLTQQLPPEIAVNLPKVPLQGTLDLQQVLQSVYFFG